MDTLIPDTLVQGLERRGWVPADRDEHVDLLVTEGKYQWSITEVACHMNSRMDSSIITNKVRLHEFLNHYDPELIAETSVISTASDLKDFVDNFTDGVWIWRPEGGWSGTGVQIFSRSEANILDKLTGAWRRLNPPGKHLKRAILSRYEEQPLLLSLPDGRPGYKFHLRLHLLVVIDKHGRRAALYPTGDIVFSDEPYENKNFSNTAVHDTHVRKHATGQFPDEFDKLAQGSIGTEEVWDKAKEILGRVCASTLTQVHPYAECTNGFEILGCDFMINSSGHMWLVEINSKPGFSDNREWKAPRSLELYSGVLNYAVTDSIHTEPTLDATILTPDGSKQTKMIEVYNKPIEIPSLTYAVAESTDPINADMKVEVLTNILNDRNWHGRNLGLKEVSLAWGENNVVHQDGSEERWKRFSDQRAQLKNSLNGGKQDVANKSRLYDTLRRLNLALDSIPVTKPLREVNNVGDKVLFVKDAKSCAQKGVFVVTTDDQLAKIKRDNSRSLHNWIASHAVENPALWYDDDDQPDNGYKFHLRVYVLVSVEHGIGRVYANTNWWRVLTAGVPYTTDWNVLDAHLSGGSSTKTNYNWLETAKKFTRKDPTWIRNATQSVINLMSEVGQAIARSSGPYPESTSAYEIFGPDIMLDQNGKAWLIEVNSHPGYSIDRPVLNEHVSDIMFNWQLESVVLPYFGEGQRPDPLWIGPTAKAGILTPHLELIRKDGLHIEYDDEGWDLYGIMDTDPDTSVVLCRINKDLSWTFTNEAPKAKLDAVVRDMVKVLSKAVGLR